MTRYIISCPYVSSGLKSTYNKDFNIIEKSDTNTICHTYSPVTSKWKQTKKIPRKYMGITTICLTTTLSDVISKKTALAGIVSSSYMISFNSKEEAFLAKAYLINEMRIRYEEEINELLERMKRNVPDVSDIINDIHSRYPEYLL